MQPPQQAANKGRQRIWMFWRDIINEGKEDDFCISLCNLWTDDKEQRLDRLNIIIININLGEKLLCLDMAFHDYVVSVCSTLVSAFFICE